MDTQTAETEHTISLRDGGELDFDGLLLGSATSKSMQHRPHTGQFAMPNERCSACRWTTVSVYAVHKIVGETAGNGDRQYIDGTQDQPPQGPYLIHFEAGSIVPGDEPRMRNKWLRTATEVIQSAVYKGNLEGPNRQAIAEAAGRDEHIAAAFRVW